MLIPEERKSEQQIAWATRLSVSSTTQTHITPVKLKDTNFKASHVQGNKLFQPMYLAIKPVGLESLLSEVLDHCDKIVKGINYWVDQQLNSNLVIQYICNAQNL